MAYILALNHKVKDYVTFKTHFDGSLSRRKSAGEKSYRIYHTSEDPNNLVILFEWTSLEDFWHYAQSAELKQAQREAGVVGEPQVLVLEEVAGGFL